MVASGYHFVYPGLIVILFGSRLVTSTKQCTNDVPWVLTNFEHSASYSDPPSPLCIPSGCPYTNQPSPQHTPNGHLYSNDHPHHNEPAQPPSWHSRLSFACQFIIQLCQSSLHAPHTVPQDHSMHQKNVETGSSDSEDSFDQAHNLASSANLKAYRIQKEAYLANHYASKMASDHGKKDESIDFKYIAKGHYMNTRFHKEEIKKLNLAKQNDNDRSKTTLVDAVHSRDNAFVSETQARWSIQRAEAAYGKRPEDGTKPWISKN